MAELCRKPSTGSCGGSVEPSARLRLEPWVVVGRRSPIGTFRFVIEVTPTPGAVALGHLAAHVDDLAVLGKLPEDSANSEVLKLLIG